jgi:hypothetical protein
MWLRALLISALKWIAYIAASSVLLRFVLPDGWSGYALSFPLWVLAFVIAFVFAEWLFGARSADRRDTAIALGVWMAVTIVLQAILTAFVIGDVYVFLNSYDTYIQLLLEILAILLAARWMRMKRVHAVLGEGLAE